MIPDVEEKRERAQNCVNILTGEQALNNNNPKVPVNAILLLDNYVFFAVGVSQHQTWKKLLNQVTENNTCLNFIKVSF